MPESYEVVQRWIAAVNAGDVPEVMSLSAGNIEMIGPRGPARGQPVLRDWIERTHLRMETRRAFAREAVVVALQHVEWRDAKGTPIAEAVVANRFVVDAGRVAVVARYDDLADALRDAQLDESDELTFQQK